MSDATYIYNLSVAKSELTRSVILHVSFHAWGQLQTLATHILLCRLSACHLYFASRCDVCIILLYTPTSNQCNGDGVTRRLCVLTFISASTWFQTNMGIKWAKFHFILMSSDLPPAVMFSPSVDPTNRIRITEKTISHHFINIDLRMCCCWILTGSIVHQFLKCNFILPSSWQHR